MKGECGEICTLFPKATVGADPRINVTNLALGKHWINISYRRPSLITTDKDKSNIFMEAIKKSDKCHKILYRIHF